MGEPSLPDISWLTAFVDLLPRLRAEGVWSIKVGAVEVTFNSQVSQTFLSTESLEKAADTVEPQSPLDRLEAALFPPRAE